MSKPKYTYCDTSVFLAFFMSEVGRITVVKQLFEEIQKDSERKVTTSVFAITEVSHIVEERATQKLGDGFEEKLDKFWSDSSLIEFVEFHEPMARRARELIRNAIPLGHVLKPIDAIHLVSAQYTGAGECFTFDKRLFKFSTNIGMEVREPYVLQPKLIDVN
jgi:predicted nucleic acid-binding protein